ncbi:MAG: glycosyltransferase [Flavobacteriaceae bacterium]|nr:glycosyltransferase [Flavobacteriaceae bacterium]|tara:strand:+ start:1081 stop:2025 length:945 start_codon:yes stop_codon:yes gene_type:complete
MEISIVIPLFNESESLEELHDWILSSISSNSKSFEIIFIDDGSSDNSWQIIKNLANKNKDTRGILFSKNFGKSQALNAGFKLAKGDYVITMDADLQDSPDEIIKMIKTLKEKKLDIVSGWKKKRHDSFFLKNLPSKLFNWAARRVSGIYLHDFNCGIKAYRNDVIKSIDVYGEMHRYIPVIASNMGYTKIEEQIVKHQARKYGKTKFGSSRFINGFLDLITIWFLNKFGKRPMHFFGFWGTLMLLVSFVFILYIGLDKLYFTKSGKLIAQRTEFFIALTTMIIGIQLFVAGFLGEMFLKSKKGVKRYIIGEKTN